MTSFSDEDYERTLLQLPRVLVFKIPTLKSAGGHRAADWPTTPIWTGKLRIVEKGKIAVIILADDSNATFAVCPVTDDASVDRTVDSGRYFVLRIENNQGKKAFIGIAFNERNDAFDFNVALSEHKASVDRENKAKELFNNESITSTFKDLSLKDGEKVKINIPAATGSSSRAAKRSASSSATSSGGLLAPPPGSKSLLSPPPQKPHNPVQAVSQQREILPNDSNTNGFDVFGSSNNSTDNTHQISDPFASVSSSTTKSTTGPVDLLDF